MAKLPIFSSRDFDWRKNEGFSDVNRLGVRQPLNRGFYVRSERTKELRLFLYDNETMENNDFFDGEGYAFFVPGGDLKVQIWNS